QYARGAPRTGDRPAHRRGQSQACRHDRRPQEGCGRGLGARSVDPAADVDWSMGSHAARLADWDVALQIGKRVAGPGPIVPPEARARMREVRAAHVLRAQEPEAWVSDLTGL